uniref:PepSY domain-containing protein n=1 Tax=Thaumasiovibrio occultus TaxID=1891184 RepID=UPI000B35C742|nr:PepSY domain-containing protein [Thaumasiovibrio occultus]
MKKSTVFKPAAVALVFGMTAFASYAEEAPTSLDQDAISLTQAVSIAKQSTGATPMEAERDVEMGQAIYEIDLINQNGEEVHAVVHAKTGEVILTQQRRGGDEGDDEGHDDGDDDQLENALWLSGVNKGDVLSLEQAVAKAEAQMGGKAWSVELEDEDDALLYDIELLNANGKHVETQISASPAKS